MQKDLFGKNVASKKKTRLEIMLASYDKKSFTDRLERLGYLKKVFPKGFGFVSDLETAYILDEAKMAFVDGAFISTILLSQAFIERKFQGYYSGLGFANIAKKGLKAIIDHAKQNGTIHVFLLDKVDELRKIRNPFVHLKEYEHEYNLSQRMYKSYIKTKQFKQPFQLLYEDAKAAISLMYVVAVTEFN